MDVFFGDFFLIFPPSSWMKERKTFRHRKEKASNTHTTNVNREKSSEPTHTWSVNFFSTIKTPLMNESDEAFVPIVADVIRTDPSLLTSSAIVALDLWMNRKQYGNKSIERLLMKSTLSLCNAIILQWSFYCAISIVADPQLRKTPQWKREKDLHQNFLAR